MAFTPRVSIIIAVKNAKAHLQETLESLRVQRYAPLEVIVIDGGSTDGTRELVERSADIVDNFVSEPDKGISDAFNKGLTLATGEYINFQGAGDCLDSPDAIMRLFEELDPSYKLICGQVKRVTEDGKQTIWIAPKRAKDFKPSSLLFKMPLPHQALFTHRDFFQKFGPFDLNVQFAMDYELLLRAYHQFPKTIVKEILVSRWRAGGVGANRMNEIFSEYHRIKLMHHVAPGFILSMIDAFTRLKYIIKAKTLKLAY